MHLLMNPYVLIGIALVFSHGWAFNQGDQYRHRKHIAAIEATNKLIRTVNARETEVAAKEDDLRNKALSDAGPVLLAAGKCVASPELAAALSRIK